MEAAPAICSNCHQPFPADRIDLHEAYCIRHIRQCPLCPKMIDINDQEAHQLQAHSGKNCEFCSDKIKDEQWGSHQVNCGKKPILCKYCQNNIPQGQLQRHLSACSTRTKPCPTCTKPITLKDYDQHVPVCQRRREQRAQVSQDPYRNNRRQGAQRVADRQRQNSTNVRQQPRVPSVTKLHKPANIKPSCMIGPEIIKPAIDPVPISIRLALKGKPDAKIQGPRPPLKSKN